MQKKQILTILVLVVLLLDHFLEELSHFYI